MLLATLIFAGRDWLAPVAGTLVGAMLILSWDLWRGSGTERDRWRWLSAGLKALAFAALAACLLEPTWVAQRAKPGANFFLVVADNSESMQIHDPSDSRSRGQMLLELAGKADAKWLKKLSEDFQVRTYAFDTRLRSTPRLDELKFDGRSSALQTALSGLAERFKGQPVAGVLLLSDGNATDTVSGQIGAANLPPVFPVLIGQDKPPRDVAIDQITTSQSAFEDAPVTIQATVLAPGYESQPIVAQLTDPDGTKVAEQRLTTSEPGEKLAFRFQVRPEKSGVAFYSLRVASAGETNQFQSGSLSREATLVNNQRAIVVNRKRGPYRLLYVGGRPNWEFKFLNRAMQQDPEMQLSALLRIARREPKFDFRGRRGETSNPLFRGFDRTSEETERYDQPVLKRLFTREDELVAGFPKSAEELFGYHALILDDIESAFFTTDQLRLMQRFVSERGGGFLMLGGQESFADGAYQRTPVADVLPVYLTRPELAPGAGSGSRYKLSLSREGWLQPWARLRETEQEEKARLEALAPYQVLNRVGNPKPAASIISQASDEQGRLTPAIVGQQFGLGRSAAVLLGDLWHGGLQSEKAQSDLGKTWRQLVRWLVADVPEHVTLTAKPIPGDPQSGVNLDVRVLDKQFKPLDLANVRIHVAGPPSASKLLPAATPPSSPSVTNTIRILADSASSEAGAYVSEFVPRLNGGYFAEAVVTDEKGVELGRSQAGWVADPGSEEFKSLSPNQPLLETLARQTGGQMLQPTIAALESFAASIPNRKAPITESWSEPLWHRSSIFLFALCCMIADWGLRRTRGLA